MQDERPRPLNPEYVKAVEAFEGIRTRIPRAEARASKFTRVRNAALGVIMLGGAGALAAHITEQNPWVERAAAGVAIATVGTAANTANQRRWAIQSRDGMHDRAHVLVQQLGIDTPEWLPELPAPAEAEAETE